MPVSLLVGDAETLGDGGVFMILKFNCKKAQLLGALEEFSRYQELHD